MSLGPLMLDIAGTALLGEAEHTAEAGRNWP